MNNSIRNQVMAGILGAATVIGVADIIGTEAGRALSGQKTVTETIYNNIQDNIKDAKLEKELRQIDEQAIRDYGIQAKSYTEAKQKLDSIKFNEICARLGVPVPQKPQMTGDAITDIFNTTEYNNQKSIIMLKDIENTLNKIK